ncbi:MAG: PAS domain-containing protein [Verrucomicrobiaceae bacterium]|nr:PAS domain-containing protein [Verrucomicrobiaceae bacterium]
MIGAIITACFAFAYIIWMKRRHQDDLALALRKQSQGSSNEKSHEARVQALLDAMVEGVIVLDGSLRILLVNSALKDMFQLRQDVAGKTLMEALRHHQLQDMAARALSEGRFFEGEMKLVSITGLERVYSINGARIGRHEGVVLVCHDVTAIKQLERSRTEFIGNVSHELRTPLSIIKGYAETLSTPPFVEADAVKYARIIERHSDRLTALVEDLITISGLESGQLQLHKIPTALKPLVESVFAELAAKAESRGVTLKCEMPFDLTREVDSSRLRQVFTNLVDNAIKYGSENGTVQVVADGDCICVTDDGPGIPAEARERVFERFFRVDKARSRDTGGTGLGLAIVKHILLAHGGGIRVEQNQPTGAKFVIQLPAD